ncbi:MAG: class I SAM-dependent methyltransferase [Planctomycetaceae bacterium]
MLPRTLEPEVMDTELEAVDYDSMDHSTVNRAFVDDLLTFAATVRVGGLSSSSTTILDLGTGTALIPLQLMSAASITGTLLACDLSREMLKLAGQHIRRQRRETHVLPVFCDCKRLPVANACCDVVISNSIVHHIPEPLRLFQEMRRVLRPSGILFVRDLLRPNSAAVVEHLVERHAGSENDHQRQMFRQSLHAALTVEEVSQLLMRTGVSNGRVQATSDRHWTVACQG